MRLVFFYLEIKGRNEEEGGGERFVVDGDCGGIRFEEIIPKTLDLRVSICMMKMSSTLSADP